MKKYLLVPVLSLFVGCGDTTHKEAGQEGFAQKDPKKAPSAVAKSCPNGDAYPFDKCGKDQRKPLPLEELPRPIPALPAYASVTDLSRLEALDDILAGDWIGVPFLLGSLKDSRVYLRFGRDHTFHASYFENYENTEKTVTQLFDTISGTYSIMQGGLLLKISKISPTFFLFYSGYTWFNGDLKQVNIPVGLREGRKTMTFHMDKHGFEVLNVFVKKES